MDTKRTLVNEFSEQSYDAGHNTVERYKSIAKTYAYTEGVIAVLSDLKCNRSYIYAGDFAGRVALDNDIAGDEISSIWETAIFDLIPADDLERKHLEELQFFHYVKQQPRRKRRYNVLYSPLRMRTRHGGYVNALHRIFYAESPKSDSVCLALCLYGENALNITKPVICNITDGTQIALDRFQSSNLLSQREIEVLKLVSVGYSSKQIAESLLISVFTVSRHRQNIIEKLNATNTPDACRIAKQLKIIE